VATVQPSETPIGNPPAGWYPDPDHPTTQQRYWDGGAWTEQLAPYAPPAEAPAWLVGTGYVLSITMIGGLIVGTALAARKDSNAPWVLGLSLFFLTACIIIGAIEEA
jgi:resuscitation-promoting factor RpfB